MGGARRFGWAFAAGAALLACGCDSRTGSAGGKSGPSREVDTISHMGANPAPVVDPTGSVQIYKGAKHQIGCENNLQQLYLTLQSFVNKKGEYPKPGSFYREMLESGDIMELGICAVPRANATKQEVEMQAGDKVYHVTMDKLNDSTPPGKPIVWDPVAFEDGRHYLTFGGSVQFATEEQFQQMLAKWEGK